MIRAGVALLLLLAACGSITTTSELLADSAAGASDGRDSSTGGASGTAGPDASGAGLRAAGVAMDALSAEAPDPGGHHPLPSCPGLSHLEPCPAAGVVAGKRYAYCYTACSSTSGALIATCDNNNGACVASCADCAP
jgi:hypothetical protein